MPGQRGLPLSDPGRFERSGDQVLVGRIQIQQVLFNLLRNALESMQGSARRELTVSVAPTAENLIAVRVADTGTGIEPEVMDRLFQPFFTTKKQGMGVGLSICRTIMEAHDGKISVEANPGGGTIFCVTLPGIPYEELTHDGWQGRLRHRRQFHRLHAPVALCRA